MESNSYNFQKNLCAFPQLPNQWKSSFNQNNINNTNDIERNNPFGNNNVSGTNDKFDWHGRKNPFENNNVSHTYDDFDRNRNGKRKRLNNHVVNNPSINVKNFYEWALDIGNHNTDKIIEYTKSQEKQELKEKQNLDENCLQKRLFEYTWAELEDLEEKYNKKQSDSDLSIEHEKSQELGLKSRSKHITQQEIQKMEEKYKQKKLEKYISIEKEKTLELQEKYMEKQMEKYASIDLKKLQDYEQNQQLKQITLQVKKEVEEKYTNGFLLIEQKKLQEQEKQVKVEQKKLQEQEKKLKLEQKKLQEQEKKLKLEQEKQLKSKQIENQIDEQFIALIKSNLSNDVSMCSICTENNADTAVIPCGHKFFCYDCIDLYHKTHKLKGCPLCRKEILCVTRIFS